MITTTIKGHKIYLKDDKWYYSDTNEEYIKDRPCIKCGSTCEIDSCLGKLPGVKHACCGHGDRRHAYISFENGVVVRGFDRIEK